MDNFWNFKLRRGHSDDPSNGACAMDAINWLVHGKHGDAPECACPLISHFVIKLNDFMSDEERQKLIPYLHRIAGSKSRNHILARANILIQNDIKNITHLAKMLGYDEIAEQLNSTEDLGRILDSIDLLEKAIFVELQIEVSKSGLVATTLSYNINVRDYISKVREVIASVEAVNIAIASSANKHSLITDADVTICARMLGSFKRFRTFSGDILINKIQDNPTLKLPFLKDIVIDLDKYLKILDDLLNAGPQGDPWSADIIEQGTKLFDQARNKINELT